MSDDCDKVSIVKHFEALLAEHKRAVDKAEERLNARLEGMNEFRDALKEQAGRFVTNETMSALLTSTEVKLDLMRSRLDSIEIAKARIEGKVWGVSAVVGIFFTLINLLFSHLKH